MLMIKRQNKIITLILALTLAGTILSGCKKAEETPTTPSEGSGTTASYPIKTDKKIKFWMDLNGNLSSQVKNFGETEIGKEVSKRTGIQVEWIHPAQGQGKEQFNLLLASGDMPDIIEWNWVQDFPGGPEKAISDGYISKLNDTINKWAPNFKKVLADHSDWDKAIKTDAGSYYGFTFFRGDPYLQVFQGPILRKDWLDELGLPVPATIDEWTTTLKAFKDKKGATAPLSGIYNEGYFNNAFVGPYGTKVGLYVDNGKVKYGQIEAGYKNYLSLFRQWYNDGLLDKNLATVDGKTQDANVTSNKTGAIVGNTGGAIGKYLPLIKAKDPKADLVAAPYPTLKKGDTPKFGQFDTPYSGRQYAITQSSKNAELAARYLDYGYSKEGQMLYNFGVEGVSYKMENGYPKYTDLIMNNPDKLPMAVILPMHTRSSYDGPMVQRKEYIEQYAGLPQQQEAIKIWMKTDAEKNTFPRVTLTPEESAESAKIVNDLNTYNSEMFMKFIMGVEPIENYDKYVAQLKKLGVDKYIQIQQAAYDRYMKR
jgi:putative aldouronate transport system substrate-binding protein